MVAKLFEVPGDKSVQVAADIKLSRDKYDTLMQHLSDMLTEGDSVRTANVVKYDSIDRAYAGNIVLSAEDKKRASLNDKGGAPLPTSVNLQVAQAHSEEVSAYLLSTILPEGSMYSAVANKDKQAVAQAVTSLLNESARRFRHFTAYSTAISQILRYNRGGVFINWRDVVGNSLTTDPATQAVVVSKRVVYSGNDVRSLDMRNFIYDPNCDFTKISEDGEYCAMVEKTSVHGINTLIDEGRIYTDRITRSMQAKLAGAQTGKEPAAYSNPPAISTAGAPTASPTDTTQSFARWIGNSGQMSSALSLVYMYVKLDGAEFGLITKADSTAKSASVWEFILFNGNIVSAKRLNNAHGMLPVATGCAISDGLGNNTVSLCEQLLPLQNVISQGINTLIASRRKALGGIHLYDEKAVHITDQDMSSTEPKWIPVTMAQGDTSVSNKVTVLNDIPQLGTAYQEIEAISAIMQKMYPTNQHQSMAELERATEFQAYATIKSGTLRSLKTGRTLNDGMFETARRLMVYNLLQYQPAVEVLTDDGETISVNPAELRSLGLDIAVSDGIKGIDKQLLAGNLYKMLSLILQVPNVSQQVDILSIIDYYSELIGDKADISAFRVKTPFDSLTEDQKQQAFEVYQRLLASQRDGSFRAGQVAEQQ